jgi:hypothetical protein
MSSTKTFLAVVAVAAGAMLASPPAAATLLKGTPVTIRTRGQTPAPRTFTLTYLTAGGAGRPESGSAVRAIATRRDTVDDRAQEQELSGTEVLRGRLGTLTLHWCGRRTELRGHWRELRGRWVIIGGSGAYLSQTGGGAFTSDRAVSVTTYTGLLVTAL